MEQLLDKWQRLLKSEYLRPDEKLMLNHCIGDLKRFMNHDVDFNEMVGNRTTVDWIEQEMLEGNLSLKQILIQAKEIEKEQMIDFALECQEMFKHQILEKFNETYGGNK